MIKSAKNNEKQKNDDKQKDDNFEECIMMNESIFWPLI